MGMDKETASYIINYFTHLLSNEERLAVRHTHSTLKLEGRKDFARAEAIYRRNGWLTDERPILALLDNGIESFEAQVATRILDEYPDEVFLNLCPNCGKLARTPNARQCRHCGNRWADARP